MGVVRTIEAVGRTVGRAGEPGGVASVRLTVDTQDWGYRAKLGDSVSVSGCCLTVAAKPARGGRILAFDIVRETLDKTMLGGLRCGSRVNLEHAATPSTLLGGHLVQGHVDGVGVVVSAPVSMQAARRRDEWRVRIALPVLGGGVRSGGTGEAGGGGGVSMAHLAECIAPKGSICVDGVSLTVADVWGAGGVVGGGRGQRGERGFEVALIPTTLAKTTLADLRAGDRVNLEVDLIARMVVWALRQSGRLEGSAEKRVGSGRVGGRRGGSARRSVNRSGPKKALARGKS